MSTKYSTFKLSVYNQLDLSYHPIINTGSAVSQLQYQQCQPGYGGYLYGKNLMEECDDVSY